MRQSRPYTQFINLLGIVIKWLFASKFVLTVLCLVAVALGAHTFAWGLYTAIWSLFWKSALTLGGLLTIAITLAALTAS